MFAEGIRHLEDARLLHEAQRYAAAIASATKAAELGIKTVIILDGALGWWGKTFTTRSPLTDVKGLPIFRHHVVMLEEYRSTLIREVVELEGLAPTRPGAKAFDIELERNPEYPFLSHKVDPATGAGEFRLDPPSSYFVEADSRRYYNTAQDLMMAVAAQYATVGGWGIVIPNPV